MMPGQLSSREQHTGEKNTGQMNRTLLEPGGNRLAIKP
jgi:hypothetical protein